MNTSTRALTGAVVALGIALGSAAVANALPEWDIGAYDSCVAKIPTIIDAITYEQYDFSCCEKSGGVYDHANHKCVAPPAEGQSGRRPLTEAPTHVMTPSAPQPEQVPTQVLTP